MWFHSGSGQWAKTHRGKAYYFGPLDQPELALARWRERWPLIVASSPPVDIRQRRAIPRTLGAVMEGYLDSVADRVANGSMSHRTARSLRFSFVDLFAAVDPATPLRTVNAAHDAALAAVFRGRSPTQHAQCVGRIRTALEWAKKTYGLPLDNVAATFTKPPALVLRRHAGTRPSMVLPSHVFRRVLGYHRATDKAGRPLPNRWGLPNPLLRAALLLALNGGLGATELAELRGRELRNESGKWFITGLRHKTAAPRRVPLWPTTLLALRIARAACGEFPDASGPDGRLLVTGQGRPLTHGQSDAIALALGRRARKLGLASFGLYSARHSFAAVVDRLDPPDDRARRLLMGHVDGSITATYGRGGFPDSRLFRATDAVHRWLFRRAATGVVACLFTPDELETRL